MYFNGRPLKIITALGVFLFCFVVYQEVKSVPVISEIGVNVSSSTAQVSWTATDSSPIIISRLDYGFDNNYLLTSTMRAFPGNVSGTKYYFSSKITNLSPGSKIFYKIKIENSIGESAVHTDSLDVPYPDTTPPAISGVVAAVQSGSATISFETNELSKCSVNYWKEGKEKLNKSTSEELKSHYLYLGNLSVKSLYNYQIICIDSVGNKGESTVKSFTTSALNSGESTPVNPGGQAKIPEATVDVGDKIFLSQLNFYTFSRSKKIEVNDNTVVGTFGGEMSIGVSLDGLAFPVNSIFIYIGEVESHELELFTSQKAYFADFKVPPIGKYPSYLVINYSNDKKDVIQFNISSIKPVVEQKPVEVPIQTKPQPVVEQKPMSTQIAETAEAIAIISSDEEIKSKVSAAAPTVVGVTAVGAVSVLSWVNVIPFLQLLIQPLTFVGRRKKTGTGFVYNSLNKLPVDLATVRLLSRETGRVIQSKVTDSQGRYVFTANPGLYKLQVIKNGFTFPTQLLKDLKDDGKRADIYHGQTIEASIGNNLVAYNIPLDPPGDYDLPIIRILFQKIFRTTQTYLVWAGLVIIIFSLYISPRWYTAVLLPIQVLVLVMTQRLSQKPRAKSWGVVTDAETQRPIGQAVVRLFNAQLNKLIASQITDSRGRYYFIAGEDKYYLTVENSKYKTKKTEIIDLIDKKVQTVSVDVALDPI